MKNAAKENLRIITSINPIYLHYESKCLLSKHWTKEKENFFVQSLSRLLLLLLVLLVRCGGREEPYVSVPQLLSQAEIYSRFSFKILFVNLELRDGRGCLEVAWNHNCIMAVMVIVIVILMPFSRRGKIPYQFSLTSHNKPKPSSLMCGSTINWPEDRKTFCGWFNYRISFYGCLFCFMAPSYNLICWSVLVYQ